MRSLRLLVVAPRKALIEAIRRRNLPYAIWSERAVTYADDALGILEAPLTGSMESLRKTSHRFSELGPFTHVVAGGEAGVLPASVARRVLGARLSVNATIIRCRDKLEMKAHLSRASIPMTDFLDEARAEDPEEVFRRLGSPVVKKRRTLSGGRGIEIVHRPADLGLKYRGGHILERFVDAEEASVESFVDEGRIRFVNITRYLEKAHVNLVPGCLDGEVEAQLLALNEKVIKALQIRWGMTHLEAYLTCPEPLFGEIALRPPGGYIMDGLAAAYGFDPWAAYLAVELGEPFEFPRRPVAYAALHILHPGRGRVVQVEGLEAIQEHPATKRCHIKVKAGDEIETRHGVGQDVGMVLQVSGSVAERDAACAFLRKTLRIQVEEAMDF